MKPPVMKFFDTITVTRENALVSIPFFREPAGVNGKAAEDTNLELPYRFLYEVLWFEARSFQLEYLPPFDDNTRDVIEAFGYLRILRNDFVFYSHPLTRLASWPENVPMRWYRGDDFHAGIYFDNIGACRNELRPLRVRLTLSGIGERLEP